MTFKETRSFWTLRSVPEIAAEAHETVRTRYDGSTEVYSAIVRGIEARMSAAAGT